MRPLARVNFAVAVLVVAGWVFHDRASTAAALPGAGQPGCPVLFTDVAAQAGLTFAHDRGATGQHQLPETMGAGLAWLDYDNDGWMDLYVVQSGPFPPNGSSLAQDRLFRNNRDGTFTDVTVKTGLHDTAYGMGAYAADYDNDGFVDLLVTNWGSLILYHNNGDGTFSDVTTRVGLAGARGWFTAAAWADVDGDGFLDFYAARYVDDSKDKELFCGDPARGIREYCPPLMYPGTVGSLYRNNGDGTFREITREAGLSRAVGKALGVVFLDIDLDGKPDLYVANDQVMNFLFHNLGGGRFEDISIVAGAAFGSQGVPQGGMGVDAGDLDGDGLPDIVAANFEGETNAYYRNLGSTTFADLSISSGFGSADSNFVGFGLNLVDIENNGNLDAFIANGHTYEKPKRPGTTYAQRARLMWNDGTGHFRERDCRDALNKEAVGRGSAIADYDNDGDPDIAVSSSGGALRLLRNDGAHGNWLGVALVGHRSNRQGIGARLVAETPAGKRLTRFVRSGSGYLSSSDPRVLFGLGGERSVRKLTIYWPSGTVQVLENLTAGKYLTINEK